MIEIGATLTQTELGAWPELAHRLPLVAAALPHIGHFQTRNRGTVCGSLVSCRSEFGAAAMPRDARRRGRVEVASQEPGDEGG